MHKTVYLLLFFRYGLTLGLEESFQLEENEIVAEAIGSGNQRTILLYESAEGRAGLLQRLVKEKDALSPTIR